MEEYREGLEEYIERWDKGEVEESEEPLRVKKSCLNCKYRLYLTNYCLLAKRTIRECTEHYCEHWEEHKTLLELPKDYLSRLRELKERKKREELTEEEYSKALTSLVEKLRIEVE